MSKIYCAAVARASFFIFPVDIFKKALYYTRMMKTANKSMRMIKLLTDKSLGWLWSESLASACVQAENCGHKIQTARDITDEANREAGDYQFKF
jgi:hypothetical protein